jgi:hypothetical protein
VSFCLKGGISQISHRHAEANNKHMKSYKGETDDPNQKYIVFWDMVNLYGKAMQSMLPVSDFEFLEKGEKFNLTNLRLRNFVW